MKKDLIKGICYSLVVVATFVCLVGFLTHFGLGIYDSCVADDIITAQDRINSAYQFLRMILAGLLMLGGLVGEYFLKDNIVLAYFKNLLKKNEKK